MTEKDIQQVLIQLRRLLDKGESDGIDQQEKDMIEQHMQELYGHFVCDFRCIARSLKDEEFDEVYQETFLRIVQHIHTYHEECGSSGWITTIFRHCLVDFLKRRQMRYDKEKSFNDTDEPSATEDPASIVEKKERRIALNRSWEETPEAERKELRERGRGPGRKEWHQAVKRFRERFWSYYFDGPDME